MVKFRRSVCVVGNPPKKPEHWRNLHDYCNRAFIASQIASHLVHAATAVPAQKFIIALAVKYFRIYALYQL